MGTNTTKQQAALLAEIDRYAATHARWSRAEVTDRVRANARRRVERAVATFARKVAR